MSAQVYIHFHDSLNDFLRVDQRDTELVHNLEEPRSVKDLFESIGVPHTEVNLIIINAKSVDFDYRLKPNDHIEIYPASTETRLKLKNITPLIDCQHEPLEEPRFVLDVHLGRLAAYLRMLGFDTLYRNDYDDPELADISHHEERILLSCDRRLLMRKLVNRAYFVRSRQPKQQLLEILSRYDLYELQKPLSRCMNCNGKMKPVKKQAIEDQLLEKTKKYYDDFFQCQSCKKIYWKGSHYLKMKDMINNIKSGTIS